MKKQFLSTIIGTIVLAFLLGTLQAQTVTLTFTGKDANNNWVQLNRVAITNLTKGWQETIYWPDTTLTMQNGTGIDESVANGGFALSQNNPNPFSGITDANLTVVDAGEVALEIADGNGKIVGTRRVCLEIGTHQFRVSLSAAGTYVITARQNGKTSSIKMVCNGTGNGNRIEYIGMVQTITYVLKSTTNNPFTFGDQMEYVGYATINGTEVESQRITQAQGASQMFGLVFAAVQHTIPTVTTNPVTNIGATSATVGGMITSDGGENVFDRGICYSTTSMPTISDNCIHIGQGTGSFSDTLSGLLQETTYYVRAYAINSIGVAYGQEESFTTTASAQLPTVTTTTVSDVALSSATCGGTVTSDGGASVTVRGVCWSTSSNPTVADSHTTNGSGTGSFTSSLTGLSTGTTYYVRSYATNSVGTAYGEQRSFTTLSIPEGDAQPCPSAATLTDIDGNIYNTVQIGQQCWMKENLRTTKCADNTDIAQGSTTSTTIAYWYYPINDASNKPTYGLLYNWPAVMHGAASSGTNPSNVQGICPTGWHIPSDAEWTQLTDYVSSQSLYVCGYANTYIAKALASTTGWDSSTETCAVGNTLSNNNATGFSSLPAGYYDGSYYDFGGTANFWSATEFSSTDARCRTLYYDFAGVGDYNYGSNNRKDGGFSVRCLRD